MMEAFALDDDLTHRGDRFECGKDDWNYSASDAAIENLFSDARCRAAALFVALLQGVAALPLPPHDPIQYPDRLYNVQLCLQADYRRIFPISQQVTKASPICAT